MDQPNQQASGWPGESHGQTGGLPFVAFATQGPEPTTNTCIRTGPSSDNTPTMIVDGIRPSTQMASTSGLGDLAFNSFQRSSVTSHAAGLTMKPGHPSALHRGALFWPQPANSEKRSVQGSLPDGCPLDPLSPSRGPMWPALFQEIPLPDPPSGIRAPPIAQRLWEKGNCQPVSSDVVISSA